VPDDDTTPDATEQSPETFVYVSAPEPEPPVATRVSVPPKTIVLEELNDRLDCDALASVMVMALEVTAV
jgi:hypothetical protein